MNQQYPKISIITPSYNQGDYIEETILSVLNQNYPNLEYIIIDGGSTDNSLDIIKKYENKLTYWISEKDRGQSDAINKGFKKCSGEIVSWLNSDDVLVENALFQMANYFSKNHVQIVVGGSIHWEPKTKTIIEHTTHPKTYFDLLRYNEVICLPQPSVFYTKKILHTAGYLNADLKFTMDLDLWFRFGLIEGFETQIVQYPEIISKMRIQPHQKTSSMNFLAMKEAAKVVLHYSKKYKLNPIQRIRLFGKYRLFRYHLAQKLIDKIKFPDVIAFKALSKLIGL